MATLGLFSPNATASAVGGRVGEQARLQELWFLGAHRLLASLGRTGGWRGTGSGIMVVPLLDLPGWFYPRPREASSTGQTGMVGHLLLSSGTGFRAQPHRWDTVCLSVGQQVPLVPPVASWKVCAEKWPGRVPRQDWLPATSGWQHRLPQVL